MDAATTAALDAAVSAMMAQLGTPGMAVGVWAPGRGSYVKTFGVGDIETQAPFPSDPYIRIASVTKTFTATAVLQLVDQGRLSLDDRLGTYVPGIPNGEQITVRQLLGMTSGIFNYAADPGFEARFDADPQAPFSPQDAVAIIAQHPANFAPGEKVEYSDSNYQLLALVVEKVTQQPIGEVIKKNILEPLGMSRTSYPTTPAIPDPHPRGYAPPDDDPNGPLREVTLVNPEIGGGAGAMISTLDDLRIWARALATGTLLEPATHAAQLTMKPLASAPGVTLEYGLGAASLNGFIGHNGAILGFSTSMWYLPDRDATFIVLTNEASNFLNTSDPVFAQLATTLFPERLQLHTQPSPTPSN
jgi:D-alanyl-D-alanine carboxypeptidase